MVPQDPILFHRTISENIAYAANNPSQKEIESASKHAFAHDFIQSLPDKYDTVV
jgi:ATP-binding cassette subfamily B protein